jgi:tRNA pseudouridine55 synthase
MPRIDGILLLDKPSGITSNRALQRAMRALDAGKAGHTGSLDPMATGMLPICFGQATKVAGHLLGQRKCYLAEVKLGATTTTADADGEVLERHDVPAFDDARVRAVLAGFVGRITQRPPAYSAIKRGGVPLYKLARRGVEVEAPLREVVVESIELVGRGPDTLSLRVVCGSGTYVRSLAVDIGAGLGTGAHLSALRRSWIEPFVDAPLVPLEAVESAPEAALRSLLPIDAGLAAMPRIDFGPAAAHGLVNGIRQSCPDLDWTGTGRAYDPDGRLIALVQRSPDGTIRPHRVFVAY